MQKSVIFQSTTSSGNVVGRNSKETDPTGRESIKILGKFCPCCGEAGAVLCETTQRIIYECPNEHQYETKKRLNDSRDQSH